MIQHPSAAMLGSTIRSAEVRTVAIPTGLKEFVLPNGHRTPTHLAVLLVRLTDEDGVIGHSMLWVQQERQAPVIEAALRYLGDVVEGSHLDATFGVPEALRSGSAFIGTTGVAAFAISGLEMALWDLACRRMGVSLSSAVGRRRDRIPCYQTGLMLMATTDELIEEALAIYESGIKAVKMLVGRPTIEEDVERISAVRSALPDDARLMVDALQRWDVATATRAAELFEPFALVWIEDPIHHADIDGYRRLFEDAPGAFATGETLFSREEFDRVLDARVPYVIAELERVGGIGPWLDLARTVESRSAVMLSHIYPHVSAQLVATLDQTELWSEYVPWFDAIVAYDLTFVDGDVVVPDEPGTGFDVDLDAVERYARGPWLPLHG